MRDLVANAHLPLYRVAASINRLWLTAALRSALEAVALPVIGGRAAVHRHPATTAHCPVAAPALTLVACVVLTNAVVVPAKVRTTHPGPPYPFSLWEKARMRVRGMGNATKCNQMQLN